MRYIHVLFACVAAQAADPVRVAGTVVDSVNGSPVRRAHVYLTPEGRRAGELSMVTAEDGKFSFDVQPGKYTLAAERKGMFRQKYGQNVANLNLGSSIVAGSGQKTDALVFRWFPPVSIGGKIVDEAGEPVENAMVQLMHTDFLGQKRTHTIAWDYTDDRGEYRFGGLAASSFYIAVTATPWYAMTTRGRFAPASGKISFVTMYYPNTNDPRAAAPLVMKPGEDAVANFTLYPVTAVNVIVHLDTPVIGNCRLSLLYDGIGGSDGFQRIENSFPPEHVLGAVPQGRYRLRVVSTVGDRTLSAQQSLDVGTSDLEVHITLKDPPVVAGVLHLPAGARPSGTPVVALTHEATGATLTRAPAPDGTFRFPNVPPGIYRPALRSVDGYFIARMSVNGAVSTDELIEIGDSAVQLDIEGTDAVGRLNGFVYRADEPVARVMVVLVPAAEPRNRANSRSFQTDSDGSFDFQNIRAGDYLMFATEEAEIEYANPDKIKPYLGGARRVHIDPKSTQSARIDLP